MTQLTIRNFAQIADVSLKLDDLTVLVGAQGTGKSIALQWLKAALDGKHVVKALKDAGQTGDSPQKLIDLIFGVGMGPAWNEGSEILLDGKNVQPATLGLRGSGEQRVFFIPAHRSMLISDGWAAPFGKLTAETPVVARMFSQNLFDLFSARAGDELFPVERLLKREYRELIEDAVFHGGKVAIEEDQQHAKRLNLRHGDAKLPFMTWTAGQREFTPLLLGLYHLLPRTRKRNQKHIEWVIIEEPEMGLHPQALTVLILLVLELLWRGYKVVLSTHSPHVLTAVWMLQRLKEHQARWELVCDGFRVSSSAALQKVAKAALEKTYRVHFLAFGEDGKVRATDISGLDPDADDEAEADWGGLTGFSSRFGNAVRTAVIENEQ